MKRLLIFLFAAAMVLGFSPTGNAAIQTFDVGGNLTYHNEIYFHDFTVGVDLTSVKIWTDSHLGGTNFDPVLGLWTASGALLAENDDNSAIHPSQTSSDSGISLSALSAGQYRLSVAVFDNFAVGSFAFAYDSDAPLTLTEWEFWRESSETPTYFHVNFEGVVKDVVVPVPSALLLLGSGVLGLLGLRRKERESGRK